MYFIDSQTKKPFRYVYVKKENYDNVCDIACELKELGLNPKAITLDGHPSVIKALLEVWSNILVQRCLFHI